MDLAQIIAEAKQKNGYKSDRALSMAMGMDPSSLFRIAKGDVLPSDETMLKLAGLAGVDPATALLNLNVWRTDGPARATYSELLKRVASGSACFTIFILTLLLQSAPAMANTVSPHDAIVALWERYYILWNRNRACGKLFGRNLKYA